MTYRNESEETGFGAELRRWRTHRGVSLPWLAATANYTKGYLSKIENGHQPPTSEVAQRCDQALHAGGTLSALVPEPTITPGRRPRGPRRAVPRQLPPRPTEFVGREDELRWLDQRRAIGGVAAIVGPAAVGKSSLALEWAYRARKEFPDGALYADLRGFSAETCPQKPCEVLARFLRGLRVPAQDIPDNESSREQHLRTLLDERRLLVVLDNVADSDQVRSLLLRNPACLVVMTSRNRLVGLTARDGANRLTLAPLPDSDAGHLVLQVLGNRTPKERTNQLVAACQGLPLALRLATHRAKARLPRASAGVPPPEDSAVWWQWFTADGDENSDLDSVFSWSERALTPDQANLFSCLGLHPLTEARVDAAAALAGRTTPETRRLLDGLAAVHLIEEVSADSYRFAPLMHAYAARRARTTVADPHKAVARLVRHYLGRTHHAARVLAPYWYHPEPSVPAHPGTEASVIATRAQAHSWFVDHLPVVSATIELAAAHHLDLEAWQLAVYLWPYLQRRPDLSCWRRTQETGLTSAERLGDDHAIAWSSHNLGLMDLTLDEAPSALPHLRRALRLRRAGSDSRALAGTLTALGFGLARTGQPSEALMYLDQALPLHQQVHNPHGVALTHIGMGLAHQARDGAQSALEHFQDAIMVCRDADLDIAAAMAHHHMGVAYRQLDRPESATYHLQAALQLRHVQGDQAGSAGVLRLLHSGEGTAQVGATEAAPNGGSSTPREGAYCDRDTHGGYQGAAVPTDRTDDHEHADLLGGSGLDLTRPNAARMYDYYLGGGANFEVDRAAAEEVLRTNPLAIRMSQSNRAFLARVVRYLVNQGIDQFLDLGSGIPTVGNVHEVAQQYNPRAAVAYVDVESVAVLHARRLLAGNELATMSQAEISHPDEVLTAPGVAGLLDFTRPVAVLALAVLHFFSDAEDPAGLVAAYRSACVPGSYLAVSHISPLSLTEEQVRHGTSVYHRTATPGGGFRSPEEIRTLLPGYTLVEPGLVPVDQWRPDEPIGDDKAALCNYCGAVGYLAATASD